MSDAVIYAWREEQGDVWTGEWALDRADKWVPAEAKKYILADPAALAASPEVQELIREAEARGMERAMALPAYDSDGDPSRPFDHKVFVKIDDIRAEAAAIRGDTE